MRHDAFIREVFNGPLAESKAHQVDFLLAAAGFPATERRFAGEIIRFLASKVLRGELVPCNCCNQTGYANRFDPETGYVEKVICPECNGWTVRRP